MNCPDCGSCFYSEVVLFSSIEKDCMICNLRKHFLESVEANIQAYKIPIIGDDESKDVIIEKLDDLS